ncbi:MAG: hypothetical protein K2L51_05010 [Clostridiales bacterium]|nr:hypothetical protein [Clostridiales bacterium]
MDLNSLLPLLMQKGANGTGDEKMNTLLRFAQGEKPDLSAVMHMAMQNKQKNAPQGLRPVARFTCNSVLGKLCRWAILP